MECFLDSTICLQNYSWGNSMWNSFITMCTIGYGDFYPKTEIGRIVAIFWALAGIYVKSLLTAGFLERFEFDHWESASFNILTGLQKTINLKFKATAMLVNIFRLVRNKDERYVNKCSSSKTKFRNTAFNNRLQLLNSITPDQRNVMMTQSISKDFRKCVQIVKILFKNAHDFKNNSFDFLKLRSSLERIEINKSEPSSFTQNSD